MPKKYTDEQLLQLCVDCAKEKLAEDVVTLEIGHASSIADYFVVATANSEPQLRAIAGFIERQAREKFGVHTAFNTENSEGGWILLDFGNVIVHVMTPEMRSRYDLEGLWGDTEKLRGMRRERQ